MSRTQWKPRGGLPAINGQWDAVINGVDVRAWDESGGCYWTAYDEKGMRHRLAPREPHKASSFAEAKKAAEDFAAKLNRTDP